MAHLINIDAYRNRANMAYVGEKPWHGLGQLLTEDAPLEVWAAEAGFTHTIESSKVQFRNHNAELATHSERNVLFHSDTGAPLGVVSNRYHVVQPMEVLEFYRDLVEASGDFQLETAGILDEGQRYWALAKYREGFEFGRDTINPYLLLATSCDGTMATRAKFTKIRTVCNNTLQAGLGQKNGTDISIPHSRVFDPAEVKTELNISAVIPQMQDTIEMLINKSLDDQTAADIFVELTAKKNSAGEIANEIHVRRVSRELLMSLKTSPGADLETARGTAWGVMNAVTHYVDHKARSRSVNNRFKSSQMGVGADMKAQAFDLIQAA